MFDKKKLHFWQLFVIFSSITILSLVYSWKTNRAEQVSMPMMQNSMGNMMQMHLKEATIADLIKPSEQMQQTSQSDDMSSHHAQDSYLKLVHQLTTVTVVILLPLIIAGAIFLAIIWVK